MVSEQRVLAVRLDGCISSSGPASYLAAIKLTTHLSSTHGQHEVLLESCVYIYMVREVVALTKIRSRVEKQMCP